MKHKRVMLLILVDMLLVNFANLASIYFRFDYDNFLRQVVNYRSEALIITFIYISIFFIFRLYSSLWKYAGFDEIILVVAGCITGCIVTICHLYFKGNEFHFSVNVLAGIFTIIFVTSFRLSYRIYRRLIIRFDFFNKKDYVKVMIVGAGSAGTMILREMQHHPEGKYYPAALIDDSELKAGKIISGVKVLGNRSRIEEIAKQKAIDEIIIAIPTLKLEDKKEIINLCGKTSCKVKIIPSISELIEGKVSMNQIRQVQVEDLLGRDAITLDSKGISEYIKGNTILVTGGGGSIGSELCRQIVKFYPKQLLVLDIYENNAYDLQNELKSKYPNLNLKVIIASVRDRKRLERIFHEYKPHIVFHAAAHKHVPLMEENPSEAVKNNIFGTLNVAECADKYGANRFVMISTDKAVNPTNIMGASKRACEMIVQAMDKGSKTEFVAVRFGNVLGSNGSVIPLFKRQIAQGGPVTLTHKDITRFFMTIPEAAQLVLQAGAYAEGGEIFVLDMGKPVKIYDLACDLIRLSGFEPGRDIEIRVTGLRPGEKLYEELLMAEEGLGSTSHEKIFVGRPTFSDMVALKRSFDEMRDAIEFGSIEDLIGKVEKLVVTYNRGEKASEADKAMEEVAAGVDDEPSGVQFVG